MNRISFPLIIKFVTFSSVVGCLTALPISFSGTKETIEGKYPNTSPKVRKVKSVILGKFNKGSGADFSLKNLDNIEKLLDGTKSKLTFKDLGMAWGGQELSEKDILFSPCQDGNFYLMKHVSNYQYRLEGAKDLQRTTPRCGWEKSKYENLPSVNLGWTKHTRGSTTISQITVGSCFISRDDKNDLKISCSPFSVGNEFVHGKLGEGNYLYD
ncbi:hypothetical protein OVS_01765 [Mycoplasma ovis str. Michigan]|uniref:Lipoprotein n=1 Tax=Mycoplasma ovis str. Michigan TaxID=1415773 RepID=A0ABN4BRP0_9MOLU|nr:hypothetical protein [Mycoplasma ovis]AHC40238.1 hypothetical protein OVS_01765 [Mycoplasma ovis str. Michigan]